MKGNNLKIVIASMAITLMTGLLVGCGNTANETRSKYSDSILILGSTALQPLSEEAAKNFQRKHPEATITVQGGGSGAGINQVLLGTCQIGDSDIEPKEKLKDDKLLKQLVEYKVCIQGFAVIVNKEVNVDSLTKEQIQKIFTGQVTNWKELGGKNEKINIISRPKSSGTSSSFKNTIMNGKREKEGLGTIQESSGAVYKTIQNTKGAISYIALSYLKEDKKEAIKMLKIDGVEGNKENILSKKYPFWTYEHMITKGKPEGLTKEFIDYMLSNETKTVIEKLGYIPITDMKK